jgi:putative transposase
VLYRRDRTPGATYFFTVVTADRCPIFDNSKQVDTLREVIRGVRAERPFDIDAMVVLPDHLHTVWMLPDGDADYSARWQMIKARFTRRCGLVARGVPGVWQGRFWEHRIRDDRDRAGHVDYIHWNPVKHGLAASPIDWPWSSFRKFVRDGYYGAGWCPGVEPALPFGGEAADS